MAVLVAVVASVAVRSQAFGAWNSELGNLDACLASRQCMGSHRQCMHWKGMRHGRVRDGVQASPIVPRVSTLQYYHIEAASSHCMTERN